MRCVECIDFDKETELCQANLFKKDYTDLTCLLKQIIQELRFGNMPDEEGDECKYGNE